MTERGAVGDMHYLAQDPRMHLEKYQDGCGLVIGADYLIEAPFGTIQQRCQFGSRPLPICSEAA